MNPTFHSILSNWYHQNKRTMPWRETRDPYRIWVSEIILQQTQVTQGYNYYLRFVKAFPNVTALAQASEDEIMQQWQGLGYYSRARNMQQAAKTIVAKWNGHLPVSYKKLLSLKGIGPYTAAAIASIAFNLPYAVVDGNVFRVLSRLMAIATPIDTPKGKKQFEQLANHLLDSKDPSTHNQAMMELGALICKPTAPLCPQCPLAATCIAYRQNTQSTFPVKSKRMIRKKRYLHFFIVLKDQQTILQKRVGKDIWEGLYQPLLIETPKEPDLETITLLAKEQWGPDISLCPFATQKHLLTHQELHLSFYRIHWSEKEAPLPSLPDESMEMVPLNRLIEYPVPQPIKKILLSLTNS